jgi:hypothetical protein
MTVNDPGFWDVLAWSFWFVIWITAMTEAHLGQGRYVQQVAATTAGPTEQIAHAKKLLDSGAISHDGTLKAMASRSIRARVETGARCVGRPHLAGCDLAVSQLRLKGLTR